MRVLKRDHAERTERELKFALAPGDVVKLNAHPLLASVPGSAKSLVSSYFDTADLTLKNAGMSLRIRTSGNRIRLRHHRSRGETRGHEGI